MNVLKKTLIAFYLLTLIATAIFPVLKIEEYLTFLVILRFIDLLVYYLISSNKLDYTLISLIALNILADLIFVQEGFYSFLFSMSVFIVINLMFSYMIYKYLASESLFFKVFIIPILIITILFGYILISFLENEGYLFFVYSFSLVLLAYSGVLYFLKKFNKGSLYMLLGTWFLLFSAIFTWLDTFIESNDYYAFLDTFLYGLALLLITLAVIYEDNINHDIIEFNLKI